MRVISGTARGRNLRAASQTRPTSDLIKGAIFSMLEALAYKRGFAPDEDGNFASARAWPRVLDVFAGSGALGIEALSRGARSAAFVEQDREAARVIASNLRATDLADRAQLHQSPAIGALRAIETPVDLVLADPPYDDSQVVADMVDALGRPGLLLAASVVVLEQPWKTEPPGQIGQLELARTRRHGRTRLTLYTSGDA